MKYVVNHRARRARARVALPLVAIVAATCATGCFVAKPPPSHAVGYDTPTGETHADSRRIGRQSGYDRPGEVVSSEEARPHRPLPTTVGRSAPEPVAPSTASTA